MSQTSPVSASVTEEELTRLYRCTWTLHGGMPFTQFCNLRESLLQTSALAQTPAEPAVNFCQWLKGYFSSVKGRDELTAFEANTIRAELYEKVFPSTPISPSDTSTDHKDDTDHIDWDTLAEERLEQRPRSPTVTSPDRGAK